VDAWRAGGGLRAALRLPRSDGAGECAVGGSELRNYERPRGRGEVVGDAARDGLIEGYRPSGPLTSSSETGHDTAGTVRGPIQRGR